MVGEDVSFGIDEEGSRDSMLTCELEDVEGAEAREGESGVNYLGQRERLGSG